jgi:hypothetical protein
VTSVEAQDACRVSLESHQTTKGREGLLSLSGDPDMYGTYGMSAVYLDATQLKALAGLALIIAREIEEASS